MLKQRPVYSSSESGAWLGALPVPSLGTKLDNESLRIALGLRLGVPIVVGHTCVCGSKVDVCGGRIPQHTAVKLFVVLWCLEVYLLFGVCRNDGKRPDGISLILWSRGLPLLWDFTCSDTLPHLIYLLQQVVPAGWQILQSQLSSESILL